MKLLQNKKYIALQILAIFFLSASYNLYAIASSESSVLGIIWKSEVQG